MKITKSKTKTKVHIIIVALKVFLCFVLMVSSSYALFTADSDVNIRVTSGTLSIDLLQATSAGEYVSIREKQDELFGGQLWEPNQTRVTFLKVENNSEFYVKYMLEMNADVNELAGAFEYVVYEGKVTDLSGKTWEELSDGRETRIVKDGINPLSGDTHTPMEAGGETYYTLVLHMLPASDNQYQGKLTDSEACLIDVHLFAVQGNADID